MHIDPSKSEWADYAAVQAECGNLSGNELTRNSSWNTQLQWIDPGVKGGISVRELISIEKEKKKVQAGNELSSILPKSLQARKKLRVIFGLLAYTRS